MKWRYTSLVLVALLLSLVYGLTLVPGVTWAHHGGDSGDLLTAVATGGVPHPTGYPSYLLLVGAFRWLPLGDLALQQAIFSALCAIATALLVGLLVMALSPVQGWRVAFAASFAALWLGFTPLFWAQAVIIEVYSLHALCTALLWWWAILLPKTLHPCAFGSKKPAYLKGIGVAPGLAGLTGGLALGNHLTAAATVGALLLLVAWHYCGPRLRERAQDKRYTPLLSFLLWLLLGLTVYLLLPWRAGATPASWGDPRSLEGFFWLVSGQLYHHMALQAPEHPLPYAFALLRTQLSLPGLALALCGLSVLPVRLGTIRPAMLLVALVTLAFALGYRSHDAQVYLLPVLLIGAVGIGLAVAWGLEAVTWQRGAAERQSDAELVHRLRLPPILGPTLLAIALISLLLLRLSSLWPDMRAARQDQRAAQFSAALLAQAPEGALIFTREDRDSFPLWYAHYGQGQRPDLVLVVTPLLPHDWYRANLRRHYPDLILPHGLGSGWDMALIAQNPMRPPCWSILDQPEVLRCAA